MNLQLLIDSIVRQTTVLLAQLATAGGYRAPLAHVANQVFLALSDELFAQGVSRRASADMFGMALRSYLKRIQRLRESTTDRGSSLWEALLSFLDGGRLVPRSEIMRRFQRDESDLVRGVLHDLVESGLVLKIGGGARAAYRAATSEELAALDRAHGSDGTDELLWAIVFREGPISHEALVAMTRGVDVEEALPRLIASGRVQQSTVDGQPVYSAHQFFIPSNSTAGWEGAVFDHFQAVVKTILARLRAEESSADDGMGGSTYVFDVWSGHPHEAEVLGLLGALRRQTSILRKLVSDFNASHTRPQRVTRVTFYGGQWFAQLDENEAAK